MTPTFIDTLRAAEPNRFSRDWVYADEVFETRSSRFHRRIAAALSKSSKLASTSVKQFQETFSFDHFKNL